MAYFSTSFKRTQTTTFTTHSTTISPQLHHQKTTPFWKNPRKIAKKHSRPGPKFFLPNILNHTPHPIDFPADKDTETAHIQSR
jgi:hypothetical protein